MEKVIHKPGLFERLLMKFVPYVDIAKTIDGVESVYLRRFFIKNGDGKSHIYLHKVYRSDEDRDPHDHPWNWGTLILKGGYNDEQWSWDGNARHFVGYQHCKPGRFYRRAAEHLHRLRLIRGRPAWTLVFTSKHIRTWTFVTEDGPVLWHKYLGIDRPEKYEAAD